MSAAKDVEIWDNAIQAFEAGLLQDSIDLFNSMTTISSKISFNIGGAYFGLNDTNSALKVQYCCWFIMHHNKFVICLA